MDEDEQGATSEGPCCDVCEGQKDSVDATKEVQVVVEVVKGIPGYRASKGSTSSILTVALMETYKFVMVATLEHLAKQAGVPTT